MKPFFPALLLLTACAHTQPAEMSASEHRAEAARHQQAADTARKDAATREDPLFYGREPRSPFNDEGLVMHPYNPSAARLDEADRQMRAAYEHLQAAQKLELFEDQACVGVPQPQRIACPLLGPYTERVEEQGTGLTLHLKASAPAASLTAQLQCHLAFARVHGFDRAPCPLFVKGVEIVAADRAITFRSMDAAVAGQVRVEGRKLFGEPAGQK